MPDQAIAVQVSEFELLVNDYMGMCGYSEEEAEKAATNTLIYQR